MTHSSQTPTWRQRLLIGVVLVFAGIVLGLPVAAVFGQALSQGWRLYGAALADPEAWAAIRLTLLIAAVVVPVNAVFGVALAWLLSKFSFRGKALMTTLLDLPLAVSPVVAGLMMVLAFGSNSLIGAWLEARHIQVVFALPGMVAATLFVTLPLVARELIPVMQAQTDTEEEAAVVLGAGGWRVFWQVTLPNIKWGLLYGVILTNARAMGEFGAVSVVSGHIRGQTTTIPLMVEILYNEYQFTAAFALSSLLAVLALITLLVQHGLMYAHQKNRR